MARFPISDLYVVVFPHTDRYSYDTEIPDEAFSDKDEAQSFCDQLNADLEKSSTFSTKSRFQVQSLDVRLQTIKDESRSDGADNQRRSHDEGNW